MMHLQPSQADTFAEGPKVGQRGEHCQRQGQGKSPSGEVEEGDCDVEETYDGLTAANSSSRQLFDVNFYQKTAAVSIWGLGGQG